MGSRGLADLLIEMRRLDPQGAPLATFDRSLTATTSPEISPVLYLTPDGAFTCLTPSGKSQISSCPFWPNFHKSAICRRHIGSNHLMRVLSPYPYLLYAQNPCLVGFESTCLSVQDEVLRQLGRQVHPIFVHLSDSPDRSRSAVCRLDPGLLQGDAHLIYYLLKITVHIYRPFCLQTRFTEAISLSGSSGGPSVKRKDGCADIH
jgi:hypothetical protein